MINENLLDDFNAKLEDMRKAKVIESLKEITNKIINGEIEEFILMARQDRSVCSFVEFKESEDAVYLLERVKLDIVLQDKSKEGNCVNKSTS